MNEITHRQAKRYLRADLDGLLSDAQRRASKRISRDVKPAAPNPNLYLR